MSLNDFPPRKSGSNILWRHLLNLDAEPSSTSREPAIIVPPAPPLDKNAASMRILLHDTQANFEKFAVHAETLLGDISATRVEIKTANSLFEKEREMMLADIVDLVNRSQREIMKTTGQPVQHSDLERLSKDMFYRFDNLHQQLEALNAQSQAHAHSLQSQMQTFQLLLDKQSTLVAAVTPLLPLLQTLPLLIDSIKTIISDGFSKLTVVQTGTTSANATESNAADGAGNISRNTTSPPGPIQNLKRARNTSPSEQKNANSPGVSNPKSPKKHRMEPPLLPNVRNSPASPICAPRYSGHSGTIQQEHVLPIALNTSDNHLITPRMSRGFHQDTTSPHSAVMIVQSPRRNVNGLSEPSLCSLYPADSTLGFPPASSGTLMRSKGGSLGLSSGIPARPTSSLSKDGTLSIKVAGQMTAPVSGHGSSTDTRHVSDSLARRPSLFSMEHPFTRVASRGPPATQTSPQTPRRALHVGAPPQATACTPLTSSGQRMSLLLSASQTNTLGSSSVTELGRVCNPHENKSNINNSSGVIPPPTQPQGRRFISLVDSDDDGDSEELVESMTA